jgi:hypothetical protein
MSTASAGLADRCPLDGETIEHEPASRKILPREASDSHIISRATLGTLRWMCTLLKPRDSPRRLRLPEGPEASRFTQLSLTTEEEREGTCLLAIIVIVSLSLDPPGQNPFVHTIWHCRRLHQFAVRTVCTPAASFRSRCRRPLQSPFRICHCRVDHLIRGRNRLPGYSGT